MPRFLIGLRKPQFFGLIPLGGFLILLLGFSNPLQARSCFGAGTAEVFLPGLGYALNDQNEKAAVFGASRWYFFKQSIDTYDNPDHAETYDQMSRTVKIKDSEQNKQEYYFYYNQPDWQDVFNGGMYGNLAMISIADMYRGDCGDNPETAELALAPLRFDHFLGNWMFYPPILYWILGHDSMQKDAYIEYNLGTGLTSSQVLNESMVMQYTTGIGEEMLFRGTIQQSLFNWFANDGMMSPNLARHSSIFAASAIFGAAHDGKGGTSNPAGAFLFGLYEGYTYHPNLGEQDLMTSIAIHSWNNMLVTYWMMKYAKINESDKKVEVPLFQVAFNF